MYESNLVICQSYDIWEDTLQYHLKFAIKS